MEKNLCGAKLLQKKHWALPNFYWFLRKKHRGTRWTSGYTEYRKVERKINCDENYSVHVRLDFKANFASGKEKHTIISQMSFCTYINPCP